jgi:hypothetical protein
MAREIPVQVLDYYHVVGGSRPLILRSRVSGVSKDQPTIRASWFETAHSRLLTMRVFER